MGRIGRLLAAAWLAVSAVAAMAQTEPGVIRRPAELRESPTEAARSLAALPVQTTVTRLGARQGSWLQVRTASGQTGWVHLFDIGAPGTPAAQAGSGNPATSALRGLTSLFSKNSNSGGTTVATTTVGIRGLGAEDIANAQPNFAAVGQMETLRVSESQAREFAASAALASRSVPPLSGSASPPAVQSGPPGGEAQ